MVVARSGELRRLVDQWIDESEGWFRTEDIWKQYNVQTTEGKNTVWQRLRELAGIGKIEKSGLRYRRIDKELDEINIFTNSHYANVKFPFELENLVRLSEGAVMVVAGESDSGKTALLLNIACMNYPTWKEVHFFNSETSPVLLQERLLAIEPNFTDPLPFKIWDRMDNFADVIRPNALNLIDYLDIDSEVYMIGAEIKKILKALNKGIAIIGLQKPEGRDLGYGGTFSLKKAEIYIAMFKNRLKIIKAKSRADKRVNPVNKEWTFLIDDTGSRFLNIQPSME